MMGDLEEFGFGQATHLIGGSYSPYATTTTIGHPCEAICMSTTAGGILLFTGATAAWVIEAAKKLVALGKLKEGWDSYGGLPLNPISREQTRCVLEVLASNDMPTPAVILGSGGNVHLEWRKKGRELEFELGKDNRIAFVKVTPDGDIEEGIKPGDRPENLMSLAGWLLNGEVTTAP